EALIAVGKRRRKVVGAIAEAQEPEALASLPLGRLQERAPPEEAERSRRLELDGDAHVLQDGQLREDAGDLEGARDAAAAARRRRQRGDVLAAEEHLPQRRR